MDHTDSNLTTSDPKGPKL